MAAMTPTLTPVWSTAAIHGLHCRGHVSLNKVAPIAHSPPIPSAATKRKIKRCHHREAKNDAPVNKA